MKKISEIFSKRFAVTALAALLALALLNASLPITRPIRWESISSSKMTILQPRREAKAAAQREFAEYAWKHWKTPGIIRSVRAALREQVISYGIFNQRIFRQGSEPYLIPVYS